MYITTAGKRVKEQQKDFYIKESDPPVWSLNHAENRFKAITSKLLDHIPEKYFPSLENYVALISITTNGILYSGLSPESNLSKVQFEKLITALAEEEKEIVFKILYVEDIRDIINFLQNKISDIKQLTILFYLHFSKALDKYKCKKDGIFFVVGPQYDLPFIFLESIFQQMHSSLDLCVKLSACLDFTPPDYSRYHKIRTNNLLWRDRKNLERKINFEELNKFSYIKELESLRNEFTHNGSWEACRRIYLEVNKLKITKQWIFFHDHEDGVPTKYVNRTRFYSKEGNETHVNEFLLAMINDFLVVVSKFLEHTINK